MTKERKEELRQLLNEAMENIVIDSPEGYEPISIDTYKKYLQSLRKQYRPDLNSLTTVYYRPNIQNAAIKSKFLDFIKSEFKDFINEEHGTAIQPASYGIGDVGSPSGQPVEKLLEKLLQIAIASGVQKAIVAIDKSITETKGSFRRIILLQGPGTHPEDSDKLTEIQICERISLVFLPDDPEKLPPYLFDHGFSSLSFQSHPGIFMGKAIIVIDCEVSPLFIKPEFGDRTLNSDGSYTIKAKPHTFQITIKSSELPEFDVNQFCRAISLTYNFACVSILDWGHIDPDELFSVRGYGLIPTARCVLPNEPVGSGRISEAQIPKIKRLYEALVNLDLDTREKLQIAIDRWIKAKAGDNPVDKMIDLGIAFEAIYLSDISETTELSFRLRLRAAWYLGKNAGHRNELMKDFSQIYKWRSKVVHTGKLPNKTKRTPFTQQEIKEFIKKAQDYCQDSILKILKDGKFPDNDYWDSLILGVTDAGKTGARG